VTAGRHRSEVRRTSADPRGSGDCEHISPSARRRRGGPPRSSRPIIQVNPGTGRADAPDRRDDLLQLGSSTDRRVRAKQCRADLLLLRLRRRARAESGDSFFSPREPVSSSQDGQPAVGVTNRSAWDRVERGQGSRATRSGRDQGIDDQLASRSRSVGHAPPARSLMAVDSLHGVTGFEQKGRIAESGPRLVTHGLRGFSKMRSLLRVYLRSRLLRT